MKNDEQTVAHRFGSPKTLGGLNFGGQVISKNLRDDFLVDFIPFPFSLS